MDDRTFNVGDLVEIEGIPGTFAVVDPGNGDIHITCRELVAHPGMGKPVKVSRDKVKITHRSIPVSQVSLFEGSNQ